MRQTRKVLLALTEIDSSLEYDSEGETSTGFVLSLYISLLPIPPPISSSPIFIDLLSSYYNISQYSSINLEQLVRQQKKQIATLQMLITQASLGEEVVAVPQPNTGLSIEVKNL